MPGTTFGRWGRHKLVAGDDPDVPRDLNRLVDELEDCPPHTYGLAAARPVSTPGTPGKPGRRYTSTDRGTPGIGIEEVDYGTGWTRASSVDINEQLVTGLPPSPTPGQEIYYYFGANTVWHLKWLGHFGGTWLTGGGWFYQGGAPVYSKVDTYEATASGTWVDLATVGPRVTAPLPGTYDVTFSADAETPGAAPLGAAMSFEVQPAATSDDDDAWLMLPGVGVGTVSKTRRVTTSTGGQITTKYRRLGSSGSVRFRHRTLSVVPFRVG